jgi:hypothetical protein
MEHINENTITPVTPPNILIKVSSLKKLKFLNIEERGILFTNIFHFHTGDNLVDMNPLTEMLFTDLVEVFEYNMIKYQSVVERNIENGKKGGRKKKELVTQINPLGSIDNPLEAKVKDIDKAINKEKATEIDKAKDTENEILRGNTIDKNQQNPVEINLNKSLFDIRTNSNNSFDKLKAIAKLDTNSINDIESSRFIDNCKFLVENSGWHGFYEIILNSEAKEVPALLATYKSNINKETILDMRINLLYYMSKFNKILN